MAEGGTFDLERAERMAVAPRWGAEMLAREPLNLVVVVV